MEKRSWFIIIGVLLVITIVLLFVIFNVVEVGDGEINSKGSSDDAIGIEGSYECSVDSYNCEDFENYGAALNVYEFCGGVENDIHRLDNDLDGEPCEGLM